MFHLSAGDCNFARKCVIMLENGLTYTCVKCVEEQHLAVNVGSGDLRVLATPAMIALMVEEGVSPGSGRTSARRGYDGGRIHRLVTREAYGTGTHGGGYGYAGGGRGQEAEVYRGGPR